MINGNPLMYIIPEFFISCSERVLAQQCLTQRSATHLSDVIFINNEEIETMTFAHDNLTSIWAQCSNND